jgi:hypothetical protein
VKAATWMVEYAIREFQAHNLLGVSAELFRATLREKLQLYKLVNRAHRQRRATGLLRGSRPIEKESLKEYERLLNVYSKMLRHANR